MKIKISKSNWENMKTNKEAVMITRQAESDLSQRDKRGIWIDRLAYKIGNLSSLIKKEASYNEIRDVIENIFTDLDYLKKIGKEPALISKIENVVISTLSCMQAIEYGAENSESEKCSRSLDILSKSLLDYF